MKAYLLVIVVLGMMVAACRHASAPVARGSVRLLAPDSVYAGAELSLHVNTAGDGQGLGYIEIEDAHGIALISVSLNRDTVVKRQLTVSGRVKIQAFVNGQVVSRREVYVRPGPPVRPMLAYLGPKAIVTGSSDFAMITVIPLDSFENPLPDNTPVIAAIIHPGGATISMTAYTHGGLAGFDVGAGRISGKTFAMATTGPASTRQMDLLEVSSDAAAFTIKASVYSLFADGRQTFRVMTDKITDRYGNTLPEGTVVYFNCYDASGLVRTITGSTIEGVAVVFIQHPGRAGKFRMNAHTLSGIGSNTIELRFHTPKFVF